MLIALYSDVHLHHHNESMEKARDVRAALYQLLDYCKSKKIQTLINLGDTFHTQEAVPTLYLNWFGEFCKAVEAEGMQHVIVVGNHDCPRKSDTTINALLPFASEQTVVCSEIAHLTLGFPAVFVPYRETLTDEEKTRICAPWPNNSGVLAKPVVFAHISIEGAATNRHYTATKGVSWKWSDCKRVFCGHFHQRQRLADNVMYVGSLTQQNWGGQGNPAGFLVYDTESDTVEERTINSIEHHVITDMSQLDQLKLEGQCLKFELSSPISKSSQNSLREDLRAKGVVTVDFNVDDVLEDEKIRTIDKQVKTTKEYMQSYIDELAPENLDREQLLRDGLDLLVSCT